MDSFTGGYLQKIADIYCTYVKIHALKVNGSQLAKMKKYIPHMSLP